MALILALLSSVASSSAKSQVVLESATSTRDLCSVFHTDQQRAGCSKIWLRDLVPAFGTADTDADSEVLRDAFEALKVLQHEYFDVNYGTWPSAIDWTAAVTGTLVAGTANAPIGWTLFLYEL